MPITGRDGSGGDTHVAGRSASFSQELGWLLSGGRFPRTDSCRVNSLSLSFPGLPRVDSWCGWAGAPPRLARLIFRASGRHQAPPTRRLSSLGPPRGCQSSPGPRALCGRQPGAPLAGRALVAEPRAGEGRAEPQPRHPPSPEGARAGQTLRAARSPGRRGLGPGQQPRCAPACSGVRSTPGGSRSAGVPGLPPPLSREPPPGAEPGPGPAGRRAPINSARVPASRSARCARTEKVVRRDSGARRGAGRSGPRGTAACALALPPPMCAFRAGDPAGRCLPARARETPGLEEFFGRAKVGVAGAPAVNTASRSSQPGEHLPL